MDLDSATLAQLRRTRTIDLTTRGRRSKRSARIEIWWFYVDGRFIITGTPGPRDWYANILDDPAVIIHANGGDYPARAVPIDDERIRAAVFDHPDTRWYTSQAERRRLIDEAPMIQIDFEQIIA
jgi:hypothetical protein